jgi:hypothetical protein
LAWLDGTATSARTSSTPDRKTTKPPNDAAARSKPIDAIVVARGALNDLSIGSPLEPDGFEATTVLVGGWFQIFEA